MAVVLIILNLLYLRHGLSNAVMKFHIHLAILTRRLLKF